MNNLKIYFFVIFLLYSTLLFSYYDYVFKNEDELEFALGSGAISYEIYTDLKNEIEFREQEPTDIKDITTEKKFQIAGKNVLEPENYLNKTNSIIEHSQLNLNFNEKLQSGLLFMNINKVNYYYDPLQNIFIYENIKRTNTLEKFFVNYNTKNTTIFAGNFKAQFGMGLTFSKTNSTKNGISYDLNLPITRSIVFKNQTYKNYINNSFLNGIGLEQTILRNFKLTLIYSDAKNSLDDIPTKDFDNTIKNKTIEKLDHEKIWATKLEYNYFGIFNLGTIYYQLKNNYFFDELKNIDKAGKGFYINLLLNQFYYNQEISNVNDSFAFINKFGFEYPTENITFEISYRNYPANYDNPLANSLSLHPNKKYFKCTDEKGFRLNFNYDFELAGSLFRKFIVNLQSDIFCYNKKQNNTETLYYPNIINKYYITKLKYIQEKTGYEVVYKFYNRDLYNISSTYYQRNDERIDYKIEFKDKIIDFYIKYSNLTTRI